MVLIIIKNTNLPLHLVKHATIKDSSSTKVAFNTEPCMAKELYFLKVTFLTSDSSKITSFMAREHRLLGNGPTQLLDASRTDNQTEKRPDCMVKAEGVKWANG